MRASEERYRRLFEVESDAILLVDCESGRFLDANTAALELYGYSKEELLLMKHVDLSVEPQLTEQAIADNHTFVPFRWHRRKDGSIFPVEIAVNYFDYQGQRVLVAAMRDITRRKMDEARLQELNEKLHTLSGHLQTVQEQERLAIARDIHDDIGQQLTALNLDVAWLEHRLEKNGSDVGERMAGMRSGIDLLIARVQKIASELRPPLLDNLGLTAAIEWQVSEFTRRSGIECILMLNEDVDPRDLLVATAIVRIVQEALTNVVRHADASEVSISLCRTDGSLLLEVADNGRGISETEIAANDSFGLLGMQERARLCGGVLEIEGVPDGGTRLRLVVPCAAGGAEL